MRWPAASRTISRSPCQAASGWGNTSCTRPVRPGARVSTGIPVASLPPLALLTPVASLTSAPDAACPPRPAPASSCTARPCPARSWPSAMGMAPSAGEPPSPGMASSTGMTPSPGADTDTQPSSTATAAGLAVVPRCTCTRVPLRSARGSSCQSVSSTSSRSDTDTMSGWATQWPRCSTSRSTPAKLMAQRWPVWAVPVLRFWACSERTRSPSGPPGICISTSPTCTWPPWTVPVTTVPTPSRVKARSMARRKPWAFSPAAGSGTAALSTPTESTSTRSTGPASAASTSVAPISVFSPSTGCTSADGVAMNRLSVKRIPGG